jgi:hypothetical protein
VTGISVTPPQFEMLTSETLPLVFDAAPLLATDESVGDVSVVLTDLSSNTAVTLPTDPATTGNKVTQVIPGSRLAAGRKYRLAITFTAASHTIWTMPLVIVVPY